MDQRQFEATLADAEIRLRRLRTLYDQWFHGLERTEPRTQRSDVDRIITELRRAQPRNTALRFRFNQLVQRYTTYNTYWQRITRQIEEGTYKRDVLRARKRFADAEAERDRKPGADGYELDLDIDIEAALEAVKQSEPPKADSAPAPARVSSKPPPSSERPSRPLREITPFALPTADALAAAQAIGPALRAPALPSTQGIAAAIAPRVGLPPADAISRNPPPMPPSAMRTQPQRALQPQTKPEKPAAFAAARAAASPIAPGFSDDQIQGLYQRYLDARRQNRERTDNVKLETVAKTVRDMMPKLVQKHAGKRIDFEVVVKDGRVALKPVAK